MKEEDGAENLYFVIETKSSTSSGDRRTPENAKIDCGKAHFKALAAGQDNPARYIVASALSDVLARRP